MINVRLHLKVFSFCFWATPRDAQELLLVLNSESLLVVLRDPYGILGMEHGSAKYKANALPVVLSLWLLT